MENDSMSIRHQFEIIQSICEMTKNLTTCFQYNDFFKRNHDLILDTIKSHYDEEDHHLIKYSDTFKASWGREICIPLYDTIRLDRDGDITFSSKSGVEIENLSTYIKFFIRTPFKNTIYISINGSLLNLGEINRKYDTNFDKDMSNWTEDDWFMWRMIL